MGETVRSILDWYWSESFWLPANVTWKHFKSTKDMTMPQPEDLKIIPPLALFLIIARILLERFIGYPLSKFVGVPDEQRKIAEPNKILERVFTTISKSPDSERINGLAKELQWTGKKVRMWFYLRRHANRPTVMKKSTECCWRFSFYFIAFFTGLYLLHTEKHFFDTRHSWYNYPHYNITTPIYYYYMFEASFYASLICSQFMDVRRKVAAFHKIICAMVLYDFWPMLIHHNATLVLIMMSYVTNHVRIGCLIILVHDSADYILEAAKVFKYGNMQKTCDTLFVVFSTVFFVSRLVIFPGWILNTVAFEAREICGHFNSWYPFITLLSLLQVLHLFWGFFIARVIYSSLAEGKVTRDSRSDSEETEDEVKEEAKANTVMMNGKKKQ